MQSPYGRRGAICKHFGWSWWDLHHRIPWATLHKIMVDLPQSDTEENPNQSKPIRQTLTADNTDDIIQQINSMI
jgi:hypothetical protein